MFSNDFWTTLGLKRIQAIVGSAVAYTAQTTYDAFVASAAEGEIGFYDSTSKALLTTAIGATTSFFAVIKRGGNVYKTTPVLGSEVTKSKTAYSAPQKNVIDVIVGTKATLTLQNIIYTARQGSTSGNAITVTNVVAGNSTALSVAVSGNAITVNMSTTSGGASNATATQVLAALNASTAAMALVSVAGTGTLSTVQTAASATNLAGGADATAPVVGDEYGIEIIDLTTAMQPFPTYQYSYVVKAGDTITTILAAIVAKVNDTTSVDNKGRDLIVTATSTAGGLMTFSAIKYGTTFKVLMRNKLQPIASATVFAKTKIGSGYYAQVQAIEKAGDIYSGWTTNYPETHTIPSDWGQPVSLVLTTNTYNMYMWTRIAREASRTPHNVWHNLEYFTVVVPSNGTNPSSVLDTLLGF